MEADSSILRWLLSLSIRLFRVVPVGTSAVIGLTIFAQIAKLVAFFLPLKILILLASDGMPSYLPLGWSALSREKLIIGLTLGAVIFYATSLIADRLIIQATERAAAKLLAQSQKIFMFDGQDDVAVAASRRIISAMASLVFVALVLLTMLIWHPAMALLVLLYCFCCGAGLWWLQVKASSTRNRLETQWAAILSQAGYVGFFFVFVFLVVEFLWLSPPSFIVAVVSLVVSRLMFSRLSAAIVSLQALTAQRNKLDALFFHGKALRQDPPKMSRASFWRLLTPPGPDRWLFEVLEQAGLVDSKPDGVRNPIEWRWLASSRAGIAHLGVGIKQHGKPDELLLVKLFDHHQSGRALRELGLTKDAHQCSVLPDFVWHMQIQGLSCTFFRLRLGSLLSANPVSKDKQKMLLEFNERLLRFRLPKALTAAYQRSHLFIYDRLNNQLLIKLFVACQSQHQTVSVHRLIKALPKIRQALKSLPLKLIIPCTDGDLWLADSGESLVCLNWAAWKIEPMGAGWPVLDAKLAELSQTIKRCDTATSEVAASEDAVHLSALCLALEARIISQLLIQAVELVDPILNKLDYCWSCDEQVF